MTGHDLFHFLWHWFVLLIGGWIVIIGLLLEDIPDWRWFKWSKDDSRRHTIGRAAIYVIVVGILIESVQTILLDVQAANARLETTKLEKQIAETASNVANLDPLNQAISDMSAVVFIKVKGGKFNELTNSSSSAVATMMLCESNIMGSTFSPGFLVANNFEKGFMGPYPDSPRAYSIRFHSEDMGNWLGLGIETPVTAIDCINVLRMDLSFLPKNSEILDGSTATIIINSGVQKAFQIPSQKGSDPSWDGEVIFATNPSPATIIHKQKK